MQKPLIYGCVFLDDDGEDDGGWDDTASNEQGEDSGTPEAAQDI